MIKLRAGGGTVDGYVCDIGVRSSVTDTCARISAAHGTPDILINNAGYAIYRTFEQEEADEVERLLDVNLGGAVRVTKSFLDGMVKRRSGHIVNVASIAAALPLTPCALYGAAKHGMLGWSRCIAPELARFNIDVSVVLPGRVEDELLRPRDLSTTIAPQRDRDDGPDGNRGRSHARCCRRRRASRRALALRLTGMGL